MLDKLKKPLRNYSRVNFFCHPLRRRFMGDTIFQKIIDKELPADIIYEDDDSLVFKDINPVAPTHLLIIPKVQIPKISDAKDEHQDLLGHLFLVAGKVASKLGIEDAFRLVVNNGAGAQQTVFHLHIHLLAEREFSWPPG